MGRGAILVTLVLAFVGLGAIQAPSALHITVALTDAAGKPMPVPNHALLISDNPASAPPRRIVTGADGAADIRLRPGSYTVESDLPVTFQGKAYQWVQTLNIAAGRDMTLELTAANATIESATGASSASGAALESDPSFTVSQWQDSVFGLWTPTAHASGVLFDARGLIATDQRVVGTATSVEVQVTPAIKVAASVLTADHARDVAVLWIDPKITASLKAVPLSCAETQKAVVVEGQQIFAIAAPMRQEKGMTSGTVSRVEPHAFVTDLRLADGGAGAPVFTAAGVVVGLTSAPDDKDESSRWETGVVRIDRTCEAVSAAEKKMNGAAPPSGTHLPLEPERPFPQKALEDAAQHRAGSVNPYQISSADFDIAFMTPVQTYAARYQADRAMQRDRSRGARDTDPQATFVRPLMDFSNWSDYVAENPPVLLVRVTPKLVEGFWTKVARGAAQTQGVSVPPIKHFKSGFLKLRAYCGETEVIPIHPFKLEEHVSQTEAIYEGLYVFDPGALGPHCGSVKLVLYSEKEPDKPDTRLVDAKIIEQVWQEFAPYRAAK